MDKQKKRFSRQSTGDMTNQAIEKPKQIKIQRKQIPKIPKPSGSKNQRLAPSKQQESVISHLTKRSLFDRKSSHQSDGRAKSLAVKYIGSYKEPGIFGLQDREFLSLYFNDPFAKCKIDYVLYQNEEKMKKDKTLAGYVNAMDLSKVKDTTFMSEKSEEQKIDEGKTSKTFVRCKSESNLIEATECQRYKQLIVTHSQAYSGCTA